MGKCIVCKQGKDLGSKKIHSACKPFWDAGHIPKNQKRKLSICPQCKQKFYYYQKASLHALINKHYGDYVGKANCWENNR